MAYHIIYISILMYYYRGLKKQNTNQSSLKSNTLNYRESEVDEELAFKYYKSKMGVQQNDTQSDQIQDDDEYDEGFENDSNQHVSML